MESSTTLINLQTDTVACRFDFNEGIHSVSVNVDYYFNVVSPTLDVENLTLAVTGPGRIFTADRNNPYRYRFVALYEGVSKIIVFPAAGEIQRPLCTCEILVKNATEREVSTH